MADIAFGVVGAVGVALDSSTKAYNFLANIAGAPTAIEVLANHIKTLRTFLEPFLELMSKPAIRCRVQNVRFIPSLESAVSGFESVLKSIEDEVSQYVKSAAEPSPCSWGGWGSWRRVKYTFKKSLLIDLEESLLGRMSALYMVLTPMDLSWTRDLTEDDRETIAALRRRANSLNPTAVGRRGSRSSLPSQGSIGSWAGIEDVDSTTRSPSPVTNVGLSVDDQSDILEELPDGHSEEQLNIDDEDNPFKKTVGVWCGERRLRAIALIDTGSRFSLINKQLVLVLEAPAYPPAPAIDLTTIGGVMISIEKYVTFVLKFEGSPDPEEFKFLVTSSINSDGRHQSPAAKKLAGSYSNVPKPRTKNLKML